MKKIILFLVCILLINLVSADMIISSPLNIKLKKGETKAFNLTITNNYDFVIEDFTFSNLSIDFPYISVSPNETKLISFNYSSNESKSLTINSEVSFKYKVDIPIEPKTYEVNITDLGFKPDFLVIHEGDTVKWVNKDTITHSVTGGDFDYNVVPNSSASKVFSNIGIFNYQDLVLFWGGQINVLNKSEEQLVNNPAYNKFITVNLDVVSEPTNLSFNFDKKDFTVNPLETEESLLTVENAGINQAQKVSLASDLGWVIFDENNFNLNPGEKNFITFKIQPLVFSTNETNKTYNVHVTIKALNSPSYTDTLNVFVPYQDIDSDLSNPLRLYDILTKFCEQNPEACLPTNTSSQVIIRDPEIPVNLSSVHVYSILKDIALIRQDMDRNSASNNRISEVLETTSIEQTNKINETSNSVKELVDRQNTIEAVFWIMAIFVIIIATILYGFSKFDKYRKNKYRMGVYKR